MLAGALEIQLLANVARLQSDMNQAKGAVSSAMGNIERSVNLAKNALGALGIGLSVNYFAKMIKNTINTQDSLAKLSQQLGISVKSLAGLQHAADLSGVSSEGLTKGLKTVSTQLFDANRGLLESKRNFNDLGISIYSSNGALKSSESVLIEVADQFASMEDGVNKTALATKLFGRSGLDLIPMLNSGSAALAQMVAEGQRLNPVTDESAKMAEAYNDNITRLTKTASSFGVVLVNNLLPHISALSERMVAFTRSDDFAKWIGRIGDAAKVLATLLGITLVRALAVSATGFVTATAQSVLYQLALARMTIASGAATGAQLALATAAGVANRALMLVGGPLGLAMIAAGAILYFAQQGENATERTARLRKEVDDLSDSFKDLSVSQLDQQIAQQMTALNELAARRDALQKPLIGSSYDALALFNTTAADLAALQEYQKALKELDEAMEKGAMAAFDLAKLREAAVTAGINAERTATARLTEETQKYINELNTKISRVGLSERAMVLAAAADKIAADETEENRAQILNLVGVLYDKEAALKAVTASQDAAAKASQDQAKAVQSVIGSLTDESRALRMTAREKDIQNRLRQAGQTATLQERLAIIALTNALWDEKDAIESAARATEELTKTSQAATEAAQRQWEQSRDSLKGYILEFDNLRDTFRKVIKDMAAEWAASGLMNLFGMKAPLSSGVTSSAGNGLMQAVIGKGASALGSGIATGYASGGIAGAVGGGAATVAGGATAALAAIPVWGWAALGAAAVGALLNNDDGYKRANAGLLTAPTPGAKSQYTFAVDQFESGFAPTGFARREDQAKAEEYIQTLRTLDKSFVELVRKLGGEVNVRTLNGLNEEATPGSQGTFLGGGRDADIASQVNWFIDQLADHTDGLEESLLVAIRTAGSAEAALGLLANALTEQETVTAASAEAAKALAQETAAAAEEMERLHRQGMRNLSDLYRAIEQSTAAEKRLAEESLRNRVAALNEEITSVEQGVVDARQRVGDAMASFTAGIGAQQQLIQERASMSTAAVQSERDYVVSAYRDSGKAIQDSMKQVQDVASALTSRIKTLKNALSQLVVETDASNAASRAAGMDVLRGAVAGQMPSDEVLSDALAAVTRDNQDQFSNFTDFARQQAIAGGLINELISSTEVQLSTEERMLAAMESEQSLTQARHEEYLAALDGQIAQIKYDAEANLAALDSQIALAKSQIDSIDGVETRVVTLSELTRSIATYSQTAVLAERQIEEIRGTIKAAEIQHAREMEAADATLAAARAQYEQLVRMDETLSGVHQSVFWLSDIAANGFGGLLDAFMGISNQLANSMTGQQSFNGGGIATGPSSGYSATLHGTEAVIPIPNGRVPVQISGGDGAVEEMREMRRELMLLRAELAQIRNNTGDTSSHLRRIEVQGITLAEAAA